MTTARWAAALDEFAECLAEQEQQLAARRPELVTPYRPPADLGPLPAELADQARALLARSDALSGQVQAAIAGVSRQLQLARRMTREKAAVPAYVDQLA